MNDMSLKQIEKDTETINELRAEIAVLKLAPSVAELQDKVKDLSQIVRRQKIELRLIENLKAGGVNASAVKIMEQVIEDTATINKLRAEIAVLKGETSVIEGIKYFIVYATSNRSGGQQVLLHLITAEHPFKWLIRQRREQSKPVGLYDDQRFSYTLVSWRLLSEASFNGLNAEDRKILGEVS